MKKLKAKRPITHEGKTHKPGDVFEVSDQHADDLIRQGHADVHEEQGEGKEKGGAGGQGTIGQQHGSGGQPPKSGSGQS